MKRIIALLAAVILIGLPYGMAVAAQPVNTPVAKTTANPVPINVNITNSDVPISALTPIPVTVGGTKTTQLLSPNVVNIDVESAAELASGIDVSQCSTVRFVARSFFPINKFECDIQGGVNNNIVLADAATNTGVAYAGTVNLFVPTPGLTITIRCVNRDVEGVTLYYALYCR